MTIFPLYNKQDLKFYTSNNAWQTSCNKENEILYHFLYIKRKTYFSTIKQLLLNTVKHKRKINETISSV